MCGIVGIASHTEVFAELHESLIHLQHRGQDAAGILTCNTRFHIKTGFGLVREVFDQDDAKRLEGHYGIGHTRYPTAGAYSYEEIQPFWVPSPYGIALAHNGNLVNYKELADSLKATHQRHLNTTSDSEVILHLLADGLHGQPNTANGAEFFELLCASVNEIFTRAKGAYSIVSAIIGKGVLAFRDPHGIRPLVCGRRKNPKGTYDYIFASETTMFYSLGFESLGDVQPGEVCFVDHEGKLHRRVLQKKQFVPCIFEYVYFARPDSKLNDISVYRSRLRMGQNLALTWKERFPGVLPDVVIPVPFTSNTPALAFAAELGVRYSEGLYKNPYIGRTFIMAGTEKRQRSVRYKLVPQETEIRDKTVLLLDDSIVRGTTSKEIIKMIREYGAKAVYFVTTYPPVRFPCFYGIDIPTRKELIASEKSPEEIQAYLAVDKLLYQEQDKLVEAVTRKGEHHIDKPCMACIDGEYVSGEITEEKMCAMEAFRDAQREQQG